MHAALHRRPRCAPAAAEDAEEEGEAGQGAPPAAQQQGEGQEGAAGGQRRQRDLRETLRALEEQAPSFGGTGQPEADGAPVRLPAARCCALRDA